MVNKKTATKTQVAAKIARKESVTKDVAEVSAERIASSIAKSSVDIAKQLAVINETAQEEIVKLNTVREAIAFKEEELAELHGKEQVLKSIDNLQLEAENARIEFDAQVAERREAWRKEQLQHDQSVADRDARLVRDRQREQDEYNYRIELERKEADNEWNDKVYQRTLIEQRRMDLFEQQIKERTEALDKREAEIKKNEDIITNFEKTLAAAREEAATEAKKSVYASEAIKKQLAEKDFETKLALNEQRIKTLEEAVDNYKATVVSLEAQNSDARIRIQDMATKALESSSGKAALEAVKETVEKTGSSKR